MAKKIGLEGDIAELINAFSQERDLSALKAISIALSKPGATAQASKSEAFLSRFDGLLQQARKDVGADRLLALAIIGRLRQQSKKALAPHVSRAFAEEIAPLDTQASSLTDPLDRSYLARILRDVTFSTKSEYLAAFVISEPPMVTDARSLAVTALLANTKSLSETFNLLERSLLAREFDTQDPSISKARALMRTIESLSHAISEIDPIVEHNVGTAYSSFVSAATISLDRETATDLANRALELLNGFVRPNFSLVRNPETFDVVRILRRMFTPADWPRETENARSSIAKLIKESIALLAQAGVTDNRLRTLLTAVTDEKHSRAFLRQLALEGSGLTNATRHWLETGKTMETIESSDSVAETLLEAVDADIARAYRDSYMLSNVRNRIGEDIAELTLGKPDHLRSAVQLLLGRIDATVRDCQLIAAARQLQLNFSVGEVVEFSPADHTPEEPLSGSRHARVISPQVLRVQDGRAPRIVLKALVGKTG